MYIRYMLSHRRKPVCRGTQPPSQLHDPYPAGWCESCGLPLYGNYPYCSHCQKGGIHNEKKSVSPGPQPLPAVLPGKRPPKLRKQELPNLATLVSPSLGADSRLSPASPGAGEADTCGYFRGRQPIRPAPPNPKLFDS